MVDLFTTSGIIGNSLLSMLNGICIFIDSIVYQFISISYQIFVAISHANLFTDATLRTIIDRVFTILGVVMLFIMAYEIILLIVNPDKATGDNAAKNLVYKVIMSIFLIVLLPTAYRYMQIFQQDVLTSNVIGNVVLGGSSSGNANYDIKSAGTSMALTIASAFFHPVHEGVEYSYIACTQLGEEDSSIPVCDTYVSVYDQSLANNNPSGLLLDSGLQDLLYLNWWENITGQESQMKYIPILSTIAGIMAIKMIIAFCLDIGVRVAKLGFLQVVAPIPIALNIRTKESIFSSKWFKTLKETYLDIFMKLIIIYFAMFAISLVPEVISNMWVGEGNFLIQIMATVVVILGILQFAKDGPKLIKDLFNMELDFSIKKRLGENEYAMRSATAMSGMTRGVLQGGLPGMIFGGRQGWKLGGDIKDPTKIASAGRVAASEAMKTRQNLATERNLLTKNGIKGYIGEKLSDKYADLKGTGPTLFNQSLKAANDVEGFRSEFSKLLVDKTAIGRAETLRDEQHKKIGDDLERFLSEFRMEKVSNPEFNRKGYITDDKGNEMHENGKYVKKDAKGNVVATTNDSQFYFAEYMRKKANERIDKLKSAELENILSNKDNSKYGGIKAHIDATFKNLKENSHLLSKQIDQIVIDYNKLAKDKYGSKFTEIKEKDLDSLQAALLDHENADLAVEILESKLRGSLSHAKSQFESQRETAIKDKK